MDGDSFGGELNSRSEISIVYFYGMDMLSDNSGNNYVYDFMEVYDYKTRHIGVTEGSEVNRIKNEINM